MKRAAEQDKKMENEKKEFHIELDNPVEEPEKVEATNTTDEDKDLIVNADNAERIVQDGKGILILKRPIEIDGEMADRLYFNINSISPLKFREIVKRIEMKNRRPFIGQPANDIDVQAEVFAEAANIPVIKMRTEFSLKESP